VRESLASRGRHVAVCRWGGRGRLTHLRGDESEKQNFEMGEGDQWGRQNWKRGIHHKDAKTTKSGLIEARFGVAHCCRFFKEF